MFQLPLIEICIARSRLAELGNDANFERSFYILDDVEIYFGLHFGIDSVPLVALRGSNPLKIPTGSLLQ